MIYEITISYLTINKNGNDKSVTEKYLVLDEDTCGHAEGVAFDTFQSLTEMEVIAIKRSMLQEIANKRQNGEESIYVAEVQDVFHDDDGNEKYTKYRIALFAQSFDEAKAFISAYMQQGYDLEIVSLKKSKFIDVIGAK